MKIKVFHIRLTKENLQTDQDNLNNFLESVSVKKTATQLITGQPNFWSILVFYEDLRTDKQEKKSEKISETSDIELTVNEQRIYKTLRKWRQDKATEMQVPNFVVCHNTELMAIAKVKPLSLVDLSKIKGFGVQKVKKFGGDIIAILNSI